jgi:hypothetical protein
VAQCSQLDLLVATPVIFTEILLADLVAVVQVDIQLRAAVGATQEQVLHFKAMSLVALTVVEVVAGVLVEEIQIPMEMVVLVVHQVEKQ